MLFNSLTVLVLLASSADAFVTPKWGRCAVSRATSTSFSVSMTAEEETLQVETPAEDVSEVAAAPEVASEVASEDESKKISVERKRHTIFCGNLPLDSCSVASVTELFAPHGKVELVSVPLKKETGEPRGFAFVDMASPEDLQNAVSALDGIECNGRQLRVSESLPKDQVPKRERSSPSNLMEGYKKLYVGNLPFEVAKDELVEFFADYGEPSEVYLPVNPATGSSRGFGFVTLKEEEADSALEALNGLEFGGRRLVVSEPLPPGERAPRRERAKTTKIYVGNLSFYTLADTLHNIFEEFGTVRDCYVPENQETGQSRGFGFITMDDEAAQRAIEELDGCEIDGRIVRVNEAQPKGGRAESD